MIGFLDRLETELIDAVERSAAAADSDRARAAHADGRCAGAAYVGDHHSNIAHADGEAAGAPVRHWARPLRVLAFTTPLLLVLTAVALAATGVLSTGAPVKPTPHLKPRSGIGIPRPGRSRLIAHSAPDPHGGPPWSMRIVRTTRGEVCLQIGRLYDGRLGVIGEDGAFHDDGRFHPLPPDALAQPTECNPRGVTSTQEVIGMPASGQPPAEGTLGRPKEERRLYFGLLGPRALSITYRVGGHLKTLPVEKGTGAYLIVLPAKGPSPRSLTWGAGFGYPTREEGRVRADPPLTKIVYATAGGTCVEGYIRSVAHDPCPRESVSALKRFAERRPRDLERPIDVRLRPMPRGSNGSVRFKEGGSKEGGSKEGRSKEGGKAPGAIDGVYYEALISFRAPFAVHNAESGYLLGIGEFDCSAKANGRPRPKTIPGVGPLTASAIERDVRKGSVVHVTSTEPFANDKCGKPVTIEVLYHNLLATPGSGLVVVGSKTVKEP